MLYKIVIFMKKFLLIIILLLGFCISAFSQRTIRYNTGIYGGANLSENTPLAGAFISADIFWFRIEFDAGWSYTYANGSRNDFFYINPSVGIVLGYRYRVFGLIGLIEWPGFDLNKDAFKKNIICPKIKFGCEIPLWRQWYLNIAWNYVMAPNRHTSVYDNNIITAGFGLNF